jgi:tRNA modification GTPase
VIAGQPNAGKSSTSQCASGAELAIVTPLGTTVTKKVQQTIQSKIPVHVVDTAGLRDSQDEVESGISVGMRSRTADVVLFFARFNPRRCG